MIVVMLDLVREAAHARLDVAAGTSSLRTRSRSARLRGLPGRTGFHGHR